MSPLLSSLADRPQDWKRLNVPPRERINKNRQGWWHFWEPRTYEQFLEEHIRSGYRFWVYRKGRHVIADPWP